MNETHVTVVGNLVADPVLRVVPGERDLARFRLASNVRRYDTELGRVVDVRTSFFSVSCWGYLAANVSESLRRGERVVVSGRLDVREYTGDDKVLRTSVDITADSVGPDLTYGVSRFTKVRRGAAEVATDDEGAAADTETDTQTDTETEEVSIAGISDEDVPYGPVESDPFIPVDGMRVDRDGVIQPEPSTV